MLMVQCTVTSVRGCDRSVTFGTVYFRVHLSKCMQISVFQSKMHNITFNLNIKHVTQN